ncbi:isopenicillin N synthase family oxygenase [Nakamurella sp. YIM 132087]|uniref:Isopenicillin N synthase family oxygenase n=1 Tax=Nakamurella alba TaxID=2665158 RepID=A0A7K1FVK9_9ACTN|nr:2-oxoglutarate and iron-dependent oxygenase domain-containing protein [Nakamurella alba]MTD17399.1 isopenicillin N synthase family oxygenase [Nakamurella alba]
MRSLPTIDLRPAADRRAAARQLELACRHVGLFEVVGHGIPEELTEELFSVTREFFALPDEQKAAVAQPAADQVRGWSAFGSEGLAYSLDEESPADLKEKMDMGPVHTGSGPYFDPAAAGPHLAANHWPTTPARMQQVWESYFGHLERIGAALLALCAHAWGLPDDWFDERIDKHISMLRALYYPEQVALPLTGQLRAGVHSDYGAFTLVTAEDRPGGLEVLDRGGEWIPVTTTPGRVLGWFGDLFAEWTADEWPSTLHRVVNPPRGLATESSRLAFAFYQEPNYDMHVDILPPFRGREQDAGAPLLTAGDHLRQKYLRQTTFGSRSGDLTAGG